MEKESKKKEYPRESQKHNCYTTINFLCCLWSPRLNETRLFRRRLAGFIVLLVRATQHMPSGDETLEPPGGCKCQLIATSELGRRRESDGSAGGGTGPHYRGLNNLRREELWAWYYYSRPETGITIHVTVARSINCSTTTASLFSNTKNVSIHKPNHTQTILFRSE